MKFRMLRAMIYVFIAAGWLTFVGGVVLAAASFLNNTWAAPLHLPIWLNSPVATGFAVLLAASVLTIIWLASAEMLVILLAIYEDARKVRDFFQKK